MRRNSGVALLLILAATIVACASHIRTTETLSAGPSPTSTASVKHDAFDRPRRETLARVAIEEDIHCAASLQLPYGAALDSELTADLKAHENSPSVPAYKSGPIELGSDDANALHRTYSGMGIDAAGSMAVVEVIYSRGPGSSTGMEFVIRFTGDQSACVARSMSTWIE